MQSSLSQPSVVLSGTAIHNFPAVQHQELAKAQSGLAFQQTSNTQPIPILYEHQLGQASGLGSSQLIDTHLLQVRSACLLMVSLMGFYLFNSDSFKHIKIFFCCFWFGISFSVSLAILKLTLCTKLASNSRELPASASQALGLKVCTTTSS